MSKFEKQVYEIVTKIPKGKVATYKHIAQAIGKPKAARAVGNALNRNNNPDIPCHRVVKSNGKIGGYKKGTPTKKSLLISEGIIIKNNRILSEQSHYYPYKGNID